MSDPTLSGIDFKNKMALVGTTLKCVFLGGNGGDNSGGGGSYCVHPKARITVDWIGPGKCTLEKLHDKE